MTSLVALVIVLGGARPVVDAADHSTIQAAIDAVPRTGGMLRLPPGEFAISEPLVIRHQDFRIEGAGTATHVKNVNTKGQPAIVIRSDDGKPLWRVMLGNFRLTGNEKSGHGIEAEKINELYIQGVTVSYHGGDGIFCRSCAEDMRLADSLITYNKKAGLRAIGNHDTIVSACQFEENQDGVVFVDGFNLTMTGNNVDDHLRHGVVIENSSASIVSANMIEQSTGSGLVLDRASYGVTVAGNVFADVFAGGVDLRHAHGIAVTGNTFMRAQHFGVRVGADAGRSAIIGNTFTHAWVGGVPRRHGPNNVNESAGVLLDSASDMTITGNTFTGLSTEPLTKGGVCRRVIYESNTIVK